jgi:hypothetical protein
MSAFKKPVRLQFNQMGAWRNALDFDADNPGVSSEVMFYGGMLAEATNAKARIVSTDGLQTVLISWDSDKGWCDAKTGKPFSKPTRKLVRHG